VGLCDDPERGCSALLFVCSFLKSVYYLNLGVFGYHAGQVFLFDSLLCEGWKVLGLSIATDAGFLQSTMNAWVLVPLVSVQQELCGLLSLAS